jgi:hypothetical protein
MVSTTPTVTQEWGAIAQPEFGFPIRYQQAWFGSDVWTANVQSRQYWVQAGSFHVGSVHDPLEMRPLVKHNPEDMQR